MHFHPELIRLCVTLNYYIHCVSLVYILLSSCRNKVSTETKCIYLVSKAVYLFGCFKVKHNRCMLLEKSQGRGRETKYFLQCD